MLKLLVTGASGFVGRYIASAVDEGVFGSCELMSMPAGIDIRDTVKVRSFVAQAAPDQVIHLAARSFVPDSFLDPQLTLDVNLSGTLNLLAALRDCAFKGRMLYVSSGDVYGSVPEAELPVKESHLPAPRNPYSVSKYAAEMLCQQWHFSEGLDVMMARPFNHIGPRQDDRFLVPGLARQVNAIRAGRQAPELVVGDIDVSRDFTDVRDVVMAYATILESGTSGTTYNVCSGREVTVRSILDQLCAMAKVRPTILQDAKRMRRNEQRRMVASFEKLKHETGWEPSIPLEASLEQILHYVRTNDTP